MKIELPGYTVNLSDNAKPLILVTFIFRDLIRYTYIDVGIIYVNQRKFS